MCPGFNELSWFCFACSSSLIINTVYPCEVPSAFLCLSCPVPVPPFPFPKIIFSNKTSDSWHLFQQYTQAGSLFFLHVGLSLWKLNQRCPFACPFARDHEIVPLCFAWSSSSDCTRHTASKLSVTSLFVQFQGAYGFVEKNGHHSHSWDSLYGKNSLFSYL